MPEQNLSPYVDLWTTPTQPAEPPNETNPTMTPDETTWCLQQLPTWAALLPTALHTPRPTNPNNHTPTDPTTHTPTNLEILALLNTTERHAPNPAWGPRGALHPDRMGLRPALTTWAHTLDTHTHDNNHPTQPLTTTTLTTTCQWLTQPGLHTWAAATWDEWPQYADDIHTLTTRTWTCINHLLDTTPAPPTPNIPCPRCHTGHYQPTTPTTPTTWTCTHCHHTTTIRPTTLPQAARTLHHPIATLYRWANQGLLTHITNDNGTRLYDLGQITHHVLQTRITSPNTNNQLQ